MNWYDGFLSILETWINFHPDLTPHPPPPQLNIGLVHSCFDLLANVKLLHIDGFSFLNPEF